MYRVTCWVTSTSECIVSANMLCEPVQSQPVAFMPTFSTFLSTKPRAHTSTSIDCTSGQTTNSSMRVRVLWSGAQRHWNRTQTYKSIVNYSQANEKRSRKYGTSKSNARRTWRWPSWQRRPPKAPRWRDGGWRRSLSRHRRSRRSSRRRSCRSEACPRRAASRAAASASTTRLARTTHHTHNRYLYLKRNRFTMILRFWFLQNFQMYSYYSKIIYSLNRTCFFPQLRRNNVYWAMDITLS